MADLAGQLDEAQRRVVAHDLDDAHDLVQRQLRVREDGARQQAEPRAARRAAEPRPRPVRAVGPGDLRPARRAAPPPLEERPLYRVRAVLLAAQPRRDRVPQLVELGSREPVHEGRRSREPLSMRSSDILGSRLGSHLPRCRQTKKKVASQAALFGGAIVARKLRFDYLSPNS